MRVLRAVTLLPLLLVPLLLVAGCGSQPESPPAAGRAGQVLGRVLAGPTCPVERVGTPCPPAPVAGAELVAEDEGGQVVARTRTGADGGFRLQLASGRYTLVATAALGLRSTAQQQVEVAAGRTARVTLEVDTGIR